MSAEVVKAFDRASEYFSLTLSSALSDAHKLREAVKAHIAPMRSVLDVTPDDGHLSYAQCQDLIITMTRAVEGLEGLIRVQEENGEATVEECRRISAVSP